LFYFNQNTTTPWDMKSTVLINTTSQNNIVMGWIDEGWANSPVLTSEGYTIDLYAAYVGDAVDFQAVLAPGVPCSGTASGNVADVQALIHEALGTAPAGADMNGDGVVNVVDVQLMTNAVLGCGVTGTTPASFRMRRLAH
jgi:hypothetical protein